MAMSNSSSLGELSGRTLLVLDGSKKSIEIIDHAKNLGLRVIITDYNTPDLSPAKRVADDHFDVSISDIDAVVRLIKEQNVSGVLPGFSDRWLPTYAKICRAAGLPSYATTEQLELLTDKKRYKELLEDFKIPTVQGFSLGEAKRGNIPSDSYPLIVKPADGSGSRGISICESVEDLSSSLTTALDYSWTNATVIERYLPGDEATVFWVFQDGEYHVSMLWNRHMHEFGGGLHRLPVAYTSPSALLPRYLEKVAPKVEEMLSSLNIANGIMFMQGLVRDGDFYTYDIGFRPTPTQEYRITEHYCGYNPLKMLINFAVTGSMGEPSLNDKINPAHPGYGFNISTLIRPGVIAAYEGVDSVAKAESTLSISTSMSVGSELPAEAMGQLRQVAVRTIGVAETVGELKSAMHAVQRSIDVYDSSGSSLILRDVEPIDPKDWLL